MGVTVRSTAYGSAAYASLRAVVGEAKRHDAMAPVTVVVPSNIVGIIARRTLASTLTPASDDRGARGVAGITMLTLDRLAELVAAPALAAAGRRPATAPVLTTAWQRELASDPLSFAPVADHPATVTALVEAHRRLRDVSPEALERIAAVDRLREHTVSLFGRVVARLAPAFYDVHDLRGVAAASLEAGTAPSVDELGTVVVFLPQDLDRSAAWLAAAVGAAAPTVVVAGFTGDRRCDTGVRKALERMGAQAPGPAEATPGPTATRVVHASDSDDEVRCVVRLVVAALRRTPARRLAVLYGNPRPYARLLHEHLAAAGITVNGPGVRTAAERTIPRAFMQLLALGDNAFSRAGVFAVLAGAPVRDGSGVRDESGVGDGRGRLVPTARWERISRTAGVVAGGDWTMRLERLAQEQRARAEEERGEAEGGRDWLVDRFVREAESAQALARFVGDLQSRLQAGGTCRDWRCLATWALDTLHSVLGESQDHWRLPQDERVAADRLERLLEGLVGLDDVAQADASIPALRQLLELQLADDLQRVGRFGTGVLVAPLSSAIGLHADEVFVVGLAEDLCPGRPHEDALLPDVAREATGGELPLLRDRLEVQQRHLLAAFSSAPAVTASFPRGDLRRSSDRLPSRWLLPTLRTLTGDSTLSTSRWHEVACRSITGSPSYAASITDSALDGGVDGAPDSGVDGAGPATEQEWRQRAASAGLAPTGLAADPAAVLAADVALGRAAELARARRGAAFTRFDGNLTAHRGELPDPADGDRVVSATQLESWVACPHAYFVNRILGVEPVDPPEERVTLSALDRGSILHEALDRFFAWLVESGGPPAPDTAWTPGQRAQLAVIAAGVADGFAERGLTGHPRLWAQERARVLDDVNRVLDQDEATRADERRRQLRSELEFGRGRWPRPVEVDLGDGRVVRLRGAADRLDETEDGVLVVSDYKSGKADSYRAIGLDGRDPTVEGTKLQLPVYAYAARQRLGRPDAQVRAEYWFIGPRDRGTRVPLVLTPAVEHRYAEVLRVLADGIGGGLFPARAPEDRAWSPYPACPYCDPDGLGAKERRAQWVRKRSDPVLQAYVTLVEP